MTKTIDNEYFRNNYTDGMSGSEWVEWAEYLNRNTRQVKYDDRFKAMALPGVMAELVKSQSQFPK